MWWIGSAPSSPMPPPSAPHPISRHAGGELRACAAGVSERMLRNRLGAERTGHRGLGDGLLEHPGSPARRESGAVHPHGAHGLQLGRARHLRAPGGPGRRFPTLIVYHSHVDAGSYLSEANQAGARFNGEPACPVEHVAVDIRAGGPSGATRFALDAGQQHCLAMGAHVSPLDAASWPLRGCSAGRRKSRPRRRDSNQAWQPRLRRQERPGRPWDVHALIPTPRTETRGGSPTCSRQSA